MLEKLGIPSDLAEKAIEKMSCELSESMRIASLLEKKTDMHRDKLIRYLAGRGFPYETILDMIDGAHT